MTGPTSLFLQCIQFIAENVEIVESFLGFPSQIGEQIFKQCLMKKKFMTENLTSLALFTTEFGSELLKTLTLSGEYLCLNYYLENLLLFTDLTELDVSNCGLGDQHEILTNFANLRRLEIFNLRGNCISNAGIQKMTTPYRMLNKGPNNLRFMDISGNSAVSVNCLKYLSPFKKLTVILPGILPEKPSDFKNWKFTSKDKSFQSEAIVTVGWASSLIEEWINRVKARKLAAKPKKQAFYKRSVCPSDVTVGVKQGTGDSECIIAENRSEERKGERSSSVITKQSDNCVSQSYTVEDEQSLLALYKPPSQDTVNTQTLSKTVVDNVDKSNNQPVKHSCNKPSHILRIKSSKLLYKKDSSVKSSYVVSDKGKKIEERTIQHYFTSQSHTPLKDEDIPNDVVRDHANNDLPIEQVMDAGGLYKESCLDKDTVVSKTVCTKKKDKTLNTLNRKRKRIVISRPLTEKHLDDEMNQSVKHQKLNTGNTTTSVVACHGNKQTNQQGRKNTTFLDCLDSFI